MNIQDLLETSSAAVQASVRTLESNEKTLYDILEKMKKDIDSGEYDAARQRIRLLDSMLKTTNDLANHLADQDKD